MEHRAVFDFVVTFTNGGRIEGQGFRLDVPRAGLSAAEVGQLLVAHLGLLMVGNVEIAHLGFAEERHRGSHGVPATPGARRLVELSHPIHHGLVTYPGLPAPEISDYLTRERAEASYGEGVTFQIARVSLVANTGTYLDTPFHRFAGEADLAEVPLERVAELDGLLLRVEESGKRGIDALQLAPLSVRGKAVLLHTGWARHFATDRYAVEAPFLTADGAAWLAEQGAMLVGIDSINIDDMGDKSRPAHTQLLRAGIPVVEHLRGLEQLPATGFRFFAVPPPFRGVGTFPVRAFAVVG